MPKSEAAFVLWLTGLPGSGKTTLAGMLKTRLRDDFDIPTELLDGDELRRRLSPDLGFSKSDRALHVARVGYIAHLLSRNGVVTIVALISPFVSMREEARKLIQNFVEIWVKCPAETCIKRDPKGLYKQALSGNITNFTGIQDPYENPISPEIVLETERIPPNECTNMVITRLVDLNYLGPGSVKIRKGD